MKRSTWNAMLLSACLALPGLAHALTEGEPLGMVYEAAPDPSQRMDGSVSVAPRPASGCTLYLPAIDDARSSKADVGNVTVMLPTVHATPVSVQSVKGGDALRWMREALQSTRRYGLQTVLRAAASDGGARQATADVSLRLAHGWSSGLNLVSQVVLQADWRLAGGEHGVRQYHGMGTRTNFANGNGEFMTVLNLGMQEAVRALAADAALLCNGKPLPSPTS